MRLLKEKKNGQLTAEKALKFLQEEEAARKKKYIEELQALNKRYGYEPNVVMNYQNLAQKLIAVINAEPKAIDYKPKK